MLFKFLLCVLIHLHVALLKFFLHVLDYLHQLLLLLLLLGQ